MNARTRPARRRRWRPGSPHTARRNRSDSTATSCSRCRSNRVSTASGGPAAWHTRQIMRADPLRFLTDELDSLKQQGLYRHLRVLESEQRAHATFDEKSVVNLSSNNYLGLTT